MITRSVNILGNVMELRRNTSCTVMVNVQSSTTDNLIFILQGS